MSIRNDDNDYLLIRAAIDGDVDRVRDLLRSGADVNAREDEYQETPLTRAAAQGHVRVVELLLSQGADINATHNKGCTALWLAATCGKEDVVDVLLTAGADTSIRGYMGMTARQAAERRHPHIADLISAADALEKPSLELLIDAATHGDLNGAKLLLRCHDIDLNKHGREGWTPLLDAVYWQREDIVDLLLDHGANVDIEDKFGNTALIFAARGESVAIVKRLIENGANVNHKNHNQESALTVCRTDTGGVLQESRQHAVEPIERLLLDAGAH